MIDCRLSIDHSDGDDCVPPAARGVVSRAPQRMTGRMDMCVIGARLLSVDHSRSGAVVAVVVHNDVIYPPVCCRVTTDVVCSVLSTSDPAVNLRRHAGPT